MSKKLYATKRLVDSIRKVTNRCYDQAVEKLIATKPRDFKNVSHDCRRSFIKDTPHLRTQVDIFYRELICSLSTKELEAILLLHNKGKMRRAQNTLQSIADELLARIMLDASSNKKEQSESKPNQDY